MRHQMTLDIKTATLKMIQALAWTSENIRPDIVATEYLKMLDSYHFGMGLEEVEELKQLLDPPEVLPEPESIPDPVEGELWVHRVTGNPVRIIYVKHYIRRRENPEGGAEVIYRLLNNDSHSRSVKEFTTVYRRPTHGQA